MIFQSLPQLGTPLSHEHMMFLETFSKSCRTSILKMVVNAQSGHPGGALSCIDYLSVLYPFVIGQTGNRVVVSNGHVSPCVYSTLAEMAYIPKDVVVRDFRKAGSIYEGHITRHVKGIDYGTGPLGVGVSVASALALAKQKKNSENPEKVYAMMGDGECQEGQVHEMIHFSKQHKLNNLILFVDYNEVQLTASLKEVVDINVEKIFEAGDWNVININGHNYQEIWSALSDAQSSTKPTVIIGHTIMGKGVPFMEKTGEAHHSDWHGKAPKTDDPGLLEALKLLKLTPDEETLLDEFRTTHIHWQPKENAHHDDLEKLDIDPGTPSICEAGTVTDCRSAYGKALLDLAKRNSQVVALTADLKGSVKTDGVSENLPEQYIECGIAEQHMISAAGGMSIEDFVPFASTFGAFISSRAKDQARVNDINLTNVKMVATHCGLSVGEDGPTHQAIDDMGSFLGLFHTMVIEPADANQTDHIIRYIASHYGNFYVRMGRHKFPVVLKEDGSVFYDENYQYIYGRSDVIREGSDLTIAATGSMVGEAIKARELIKETNPELSIEIVAVSSIKKFDETVINSIKKTKNAITIEDHNTVSGLGGMLASHLSKTGIQVDSFKSLGVEEYQLSGTSDELYHIAGIDAEGIAKEVLG